VRKLILPGIALLVALVAASILLLQPLSLVSQTHTRLSIHFGKTVSLIGIAEQAGGYRCYVNDSEYFWLSSEDCVQEEGEKLEVKFQLLDAAILYRREP